MAVLKTQPVPKGTKVLPRTYSQKYSDTDYRRKYGTGQAATEARIRAVFEHRGNKPSAARVSDVYKRRAKEFNTQGYGALRGWVDKYSSGAKAAAAKAKANAPAKNLPDARQKALQDALAAIAAQYTMEASQLGLEQSAIGNTWKQQNFQITNDTDKMERQTTEDAVRRGIGRSSIYAQNMSDVLGEEARAKAQNAQEFGTTQTTGKAGSRARSIESMIKLIGQQKQTAQQQARAQSAKGELDLETLLALIGTGIPSTQFAG